MKMITTILIAVVILATFLIFLDHEDYDDED